jgi:hypothetical protein
MTLNAQIDKMQSELSKLESEAYQLTKELERIWLDFKFSVQPEVNKWMQNYVQQLVSNNPEIIIKGGAEMAKQFMRGLENLGNRTHEVSLDSYADDPNPCRYEFISYRSSFLPTLPEESYFARAFRSALSEMAIFLKENNLLNVNEWQKALFGVPEYWYLRDTGFRNLHFPEVIEYVEKWKARATLRQFSDRKSQELGTAKQGLLNANMKEQAYKLLMGAKDSLN